MRNKGGDARRAKLRRAKLPVSKISDQDAKVHEVIEIHSDKEDMDATQNVVKPQVHEVCSEFA
jgi:hypothetical protein